MSRANDPYDVPEAVCSDLSGVIERVVTVNGVGLWCWDTGGDGEPVVFLHAVMGSGAFWGYQQEVFERAGYRVVGYSRRGHFRSEPGPREDTGTAAGDLAALMDGMEIGTAHIVGTAAGGFAAADFAISYPERVRTLTVSTSLTTVGDADYMRSTEAMRAPEFEDLPPQFRELGPSYRAVNPRGVADWLELLAASRPHVIKQGFASPLTLDAFSGLAMPVLLIAADADLYAPPPVMKRLADRLAHAELALVAGAGHSAYWEQPDAWNAIVLDFLSRHLSEGR